MQFCKPCRGRGKKYVSLEQANERLRIDGFPPVDSVPDEVCPSCGGTGKMFSLDEAYAAIREQWDGDSLVMEWHFSDLRAALERGLAKCSLS